MKQNRRNFLKTAAFAAVAGSLSLDSSHAAPFTLMRSAALDGKMKLTFEPVDLQLRYTFIVFTYSRTITPQKGAGGVAPAVGARGEADDDAQQDDVGQQGQGQDLILCK